MTTPETRCQPMDPNTRGGRMSENIRRPGEVGQPPPGLAATPHREGALAVEQDSESPAGGVDEGHLTFPSAEWVDGYETGKMAADPTLPGAPRWDQDPVVARFGWLEGRCGNCGELSSDGQLRDALRALADEWGRRADEQGLQFGRERDEAKSITHGAVSCAWLTSAQELRDLLDPPTDRPAGDA